MGSELRVSVRLTFDAKITSTWIAWLDDPRKNFTPWIIGILQHMWPLCWQTDLVCNSTRIFFPHRHQQPFVITSSYLWHSSERVTQHYIVEQQDYFCAYIYEHRSFAIASFAVCVLFIHCFVCIVVDRQLINDVIHFHSSVWCFVSLFFWS